MDLLRAAQSGRALAKAFDGIARLVQDSPRSRQNEFAADDALFEAATAYVRNHLADPALSPNYLAAVLGVSRRRLYEAFAARNAQVARHIREQRLERAHDLIVHASTPTRSVAEIALSVGFADPAHFSRLFRASYGLAPTQLRTQIQTLA